MTDQRWLDDEKPGQYAFYRIRDAVEDLDFREDAAALQLLEAVRLHAGDLDGDGLLELVGLLAGAWSLQVARPRRDHRNADDRQVADEAIRAIVRVAQNAPSVDAFNDVFGLHVDHLSRRQLVLVTANLASYLGVLASADPLSERGHAGVAALEEWLHGRGGDARGDV